MWLSLSVTCLQVGESVGHCRLPWVRSGLKIGPFGRCYLGLFRYNPACWCIAIRSERLLVYALTKARGCAGYYHFAQYDTSTRCWSARFTRLQGSLGDRVGFYHRKMALLYAINFGWKFRDKASLSPVVYKFQCRHLYNRVRHAITHIKCVQQNANSNRYLLPPVWTGRPKKNRILLLVTYSALPGNRMGTVNKNFYSNLVWNLVALAQRLQIGTLIVRFHGGISWTLDKT